MWDNKWSYRLLLLLMVFLPSIIVLFLNKSFSLDRPLFIYEYFLVAFLLLINLHPFWVWLVFVFVFGLDIATVFSKLYFFKLLDFLSAFKYFNNYAISSVQIFLFFITLIYLFASFALFRIIKSKIGKDKILIRLFTILFSVLFILDNINGSSFISYNGSLNFCNNNFAGSPALTLYRSLFNTSLDANAPVLLPESKGSIAIREFKMDSTSNQLLVIVESFGFINDSVKRENFQKDISVVFENRNWKTCWGKTPFKGSTSSAELRELLNCEGDYRYFLNPRQAKNFISLFQIKKQQGYHSIAMHSYKASMFERAIWWKNIGADQVLFSEDFQLAHNFQNKLNYESPFISVNDEDAFSYVQSISSMKGKHFVYLLTVNSHLSFRGKLDKPIYGKLFNINKENSLSVEAKYQNIRVSNFLTYIAQHLDSKRFQKLLIVGDHMPPFFLESDRHFYSEQYVPYCIVTR